MESEDSFSARGIIFGSLNIIAGLLVASAPCFGRETHGDSRGGLTARGSLLFKAGPTRTTRSSSSPFPAILSL